MTNNAMHPLIAIPVFCIYLPSSSGLLGRWEYLGAGEDVGVQRVVALADQLMTTAHGQNSITHVGVSDTGTESGRVSMSTIGSVGIVAYPVDRATGQPRPTFISTPALPSYCV